MFFINIFRVHFVNVIHHNLYMMYLLGFGSFSFCATDCFLIFIDTMIFLCLIISHIHSLPLHGSPPHNITLPYHIFNFIYLFIFILLIFFDFITYFSYVYDKNIIRITFAIITIDRHKIHYLHRICTSTAMFDDNAELFFFFLLFLIEKKLHKIVLKERQ